MLLYGLWLSLNTVFCILYSTFVVNGVKTYRTVQALKLVMSDSAITTSIQFDSVRVLVRKSNCGKSDVKSNFRFFFSN